MILYDCWDIQMGPEGEETSIFKRQHEHYIASLFLILEIKSCFIYPTSFTEFLFGIVHIVIIYVGKLRVLCKSQKLKNLKPVLLKYFSVNITVIIHKQMTSS